MFRILILLLIVWTLPITSLAIGIQIVADVDGKSISNLDIEKRINLINSLFGNQNIDKNEVKPQILRQLIDEVIIVREAKRLNINLNNKELNNTLLLFLTQNFKLKEDEIDQYIKKHDIDLGLLKKQIKCQLLWSKILEARIVPFINVSAKEVSDVKGQIERSDYLITFQEFIISGQKDKDVYDMAEDLAKKLRSSNDFAIEPSIKVHKTTVNLNQLKGKLKSILERLEIGYVADPESTSEGYSIIKIIDKVQLDHTLFTSTLKLKQIIVEDSGSLLNSLKVQKPNCSNFGELASNLKLPNPKEFEVKMRDLNPDLQILFSKASINEIVESRDNGTSRLMMVCNIKSNIADIEEITQQIYQQKIIIQSNLLLDNMRKNAAVSYKANMQIN